MAEPVVHYHYHYNYPYEAQEAESQGSSTTTVPFVTPPAYVRQGIEILDKDRGILSSYGYYNVRDQTVKNRRLVLSEATQYISKDYIQERLYYIASVQPEDEWNPFEEDLKWFEKTFHLSPYRIDPDA